MSETSSEISAETQESGAAGFWRRYRLPAIAAVIGVVVAGWLFISKDLAVRQVEETAAAQRADLVKQIETQKAETLKQAAAQQAETVKKSLTMFGVPLAWAIRREIMADNLDQIDQYVTDLLRLEGFERVMVAKADGAIAVASDRKHLGAALGSLYDERHLTAEQITVEEAAPGKWLLIVPLMGLNARLGTMAVDYQSAPAAPGQ